MQKKGNLILSSRLKSSLKLQYVATSKKKDIHLNLINLLKGYPEVPKLTFVYSRFFPSGYF